VDNPDVIDYTNHFEAAVLQHDQEAIMALLDPDYVKEQHNEFLNGMTEQFLKELFSGAFTDGQTVKGKKGASYLPSQITGIQLIQVVTHKGDDGDYDYYTLTYKVTGSDGTITCSWSLVARRGEGFPGGFALVGASG
jgi:hypothetical protein